MEVFQSLESFPRRMRGCALAIGSFDGVHLGHRHLLEKLLERARRDKLAAGVLTFQPHPARVLAPELAPPLLMTTRQKLAALERLGLDFALQLPFDRQLAELSAREFAADILAGELAAKAVVVGEDFSFGRGREGSGRQLVELGRELGFQTELIEKIAVDGLVVSSTRIRAFLLEGRVEAAALLLGRPYFMEGTVVRGAQRGRSLGFPTVNIAAGEQLLPAFGVYACFFWAEGEEAMPALTNIGVRPTFGEQAGAVEVHVPERRLEDLTGRQVELAFVSRLRPERRFSSAQALVRQIREDISRGLKLLEKAVVPRRLC